MAVAEEGQKWVLFWAQETKEGGKYSSRNT